MRYDEIIKKNREEDIVKLSENFTMYDRNTESEKQLVNCIMKILLDSGLSPKYKGFSYIVDAVRIIYRKRFSHILITKDIYVRLSKMYNVSPCIIEHNIRNTIQHGWGRFLNGVVKLDIYSGFTKRPTNLEFLLLIVNIVAESLSNPQITLWDFDKV